MNLPPLEPAALGWDERGLPYSAQYQDIYHPAIGALPQALHVFLAGNGLPERWRGRTHFVVLETGFGLGNNFLATWRAWRDDPQRCGHLHFVSIERHPLQRDDLARVGRDPALHELAELLTSAWPPLTANWHLRTFDAGRVRLLLALGDVQRCLPQLVASVDAFDLDGFAPALNPRMWDARVCKALGRLAAPHATAATWSVHHALRDGLRSAGFEVRRAPGIGGKRDITLASFAPSYTPRRLGVRGTPRGDVPAEALIVGAGLAGCASAWALAELGWRSTVLEREGAIATQASGNPAGLFHGIVNAQDGLHARFNRGAALAARLAIQRAHSEHGVAAGLDGLLRLETALAPPAMREVLRRQGLPADFVQALDAGQASERAGIALQHPAWWYPGGGWVDPAGLARAWLERAGDRTRLQTGAQVAALRREGSTWLALDARGGCLGRSQTVILANAAQAFELLGATHWPIESVRGQISRMPAADAAFALPRVAVAGAGYLLPAVGDQALFGATAQPGDTDAGVRLSDHRRNLSQLEQLIGQPSGADAQALQGRTGWRCTSRDRLPVVGPMPDLGQDRGAGRWEQPRWVPRVPGLYVLSALGSRGLTWSTLCAQVLAAGIAGTPVPLEAELLDAIDPARYESRLQRRARGA